ncbi:MAG TPA: hypothetical protein VG318_07785 [Actinomycetota bacterium]|nr:hypothetical protein [Actinomycetota bacterium]
MADRENGGKDEGQENDPGEIEQEEVKRRTGRLRAPKGVVDRMVRGLNDRKMMRRRSR